MYSSVVWKLVILDQCKHEMEDNSEFVVETVLNSIILENNGLKD